MKKSIKLVILIAPLVLLLSACAPLKPDPTVCVQDHTNTQMEYDYGYSFSSGHMGYGWHLVTREVCDKYGPNPDYKKQLQEYYAAGGK